MSKSRCIRTCQVLYHYRAVFLLCQPFQHFHSLERRRKDLFPAVDLSQQRDRHRPRLPQKHRQRTALLCIEVGKAVDKEILVPHIAGLLQMVAELGHPIPRIQTRTAEPRFVGGVKQAEIRQLVVGRPSDVLRLLIKDLRRHLIAPQLVKQ